MFQRDEPRELLAPGGLFRIACERLYGAKAGEIMASYYSTSTEIPDIAEPAERGSQYWYLPMTFNRAYPTPSHWRHLALDAKTWGTEIVNEAYSRSIKNLNIGRGELHRRLARRWGIVAALNLEGAALIDRALAAEPLPDAVDDLRFLQTSFRVYQPLTESLARFHAALERHFDAGDPQWKSGLAPALAKAKEARALADRSFPQPIDPVGAEVGALRKHARNLVQALEMWMGGER
jgi:hypothetical protein